MSQLTSKQFIELLRRSQVLDDTRLAMAIRSLNSLQIDERNDPNCLARRLVNDGFITTWHAQKLLAKKCKGFVLGKYLLLHHIGSGGMSHVYLAQHRLIGRRVAVKVLPPDKVKDAGYLDRFLREARAAAKLHHPNIVRAYDVDRQDNLHFIVMEYVEGIDLHKKVKREGPLPFGEVASFVAQAARGLHHAHLARLVHRDVKPSNLLATSEGTLKVLDMGLAMFSDDALAHSDAITKSNSVLGTADFLAPEQARDCHDIDYRADIYSLGCTMYYLLTGGPPFPGGTFAQRILKHQIDTPVPIRNHRPDCPLVLCEVCERMMQKAPEDRNQSTLEIDEQLTNWLKSTFVDEHESPISIVVSDPRSDPRSDPPQQSTSGTARQLQLSAPEESRSDTRGANATSPGDDAPVNVDASQSVAARRRQTHKTSVKVPVAMWVTIGALAVVCICLAVFVAMQSH